MNHKTFIRGTIGLSDTATPEHLQKALQDANGRAVDLEVASPGGLVAEGLEMANMIRSYPADVNIHLTGFVGSMATYIAMFGDNVVAMDNSVFMIHNVSGGAFGDHRDMSKAAEQSRKLTALLAKAYVSKTGMDMEAISALMDDATFFYGQEIQDSGFADETIGSDEQEKDRAQLVAKAREEFVALTPALEEHAEKTAVDFTKAAAFTELFAAFEGSKTTTEENEMDEKLRKFLESRGLSQDATEAQAWAFMETLNVGTTPTAPAPADPAAASVPIADVTKMVAEEQSRIMSIRAIGEEVGFEADVINTHIANGSTIEAVRAEAYTAIKKKTTEADKVGFTPSFSVGVTSQDKFKEAALDAFLFRAGAAREGFDPHKNPFTGYTALEVARAALGAKGLSAAGSASHVIGQALTTSDLPNILENTLNKVLFMGFDAAEETWYQWCDVGEVSDFKQNSSARLSEMGDLEEIPEGGEYPYDSMSDSKETYQLGTYGKILRVSRQMLINDDLDALADITRARGEQAARKIGDIAYNVLIANALMGDGVALFAAGHSNLNSGGAAAPSVASIGAATTAMKLQQDLRGKRRLNIRPQYLLAPASLETTIDKVLNTMVIGTQAEPGIVVPERMKNLDVITDPRLDDDSTTAWYLAGARGKTVKVFFLRGSGRRPILAQENTWNVDGAEFKTTLDVTAKALAHEALQKNAGS